MCTALLIKTDKSCGLTESVFSLFILPNPLPSFSPFFSVCWEKSFGFSGHIKLFASLSEHSDPVSHLIREPPRSMFPRAEQSHCQLRNRTLSSCNLSDATTLGTRINSQLIETVFGLVFLLQTRSMLYDSFLIMFKQERSERRTVCRGRTIFFSWIEYGRQILFLKYIFLINFRWMKVHCSKTH